MRTGIRRIGQKLLFALEPETAHGLSIAALKAGIPLCPAPPPNERLATRIAGLAFPNPLGMAAGFDKNAEVPDGVLSLGFGFVECGTVTPLPQSGNPSPRIFRLAADGAVINRLGFNNHGHARFRARLQARRGRPGVVGVNIGANRDSPDRIADYEAGVRAFARFASYLVVNISSPNTAGLRTLQRRKQLDELLGRVMAARSEATVDGGSPTPIFLKIAPDLSDAQLSDIAEAVRANRVDGLVVSNTTLARDGLAAPCAHEAGGLSGRPLFERSTTVLAKMRQRVGPNLPIMGVGGVDSAETAIEKIRAGADLVQLYTGMIFKGPWLAREILRGMDNFVRAQGLDHISQIRDTSVEEWAVREIA